MKNIFNHEDLIVYQRALRFCRDVDFALRDWDSRHAVKDQLSRASESIVENIAEASAAYSRTKQNSLDYSLGSALESAACLDIAEIKALIEAKARDQQKKKLQEICKMLVGLRKSWNNVVKEERAEYRVKEGPGGTEALFYHEKLDRYKTSLSLVGWLGSLGELPAGIFKPLDSGFTSIVLNIAEGNGRFSEVDRLRFFEIAHRSCVKSSAKLDIFVCREKLVEHEIKKGKALLWRVSLMTSKMMNKR